MALDYNYINTYINDGEKLATPTLSDYWNTWSLSNKIGLSAAAVIFSPITLMLLASYGFDKIKKHFDNKKTDDEKQLRALLDFALLGSDTISRPTQDNLNVSNSAKFLGALQYLLDQNHDMKLFRYISKSEQSLTTKRLLSLTRKNECDLDDENKDVLIRVFNQYKSPKAYWTVMLAKAIAVAVGIASGAAILGFAIPALQGMGMSILVATILGATLATINTLLNIKLFKSTSGFLHSLMRGQVKQLIHYFKKDTDRLERKVISPTKMTIASVFVLGASLVSTFFAYKGISMALVSVMGMGSLATPVGLVLAGCLFIGNIALYGKAYIAFFKKGSSVLNSIKAIYTNATQGKSKGYKAIFCFISAIVFIVSLAMNILGGLLTGADLGSLTGLSTPTATTILIFLNVGAQSAFNLEVAFNYTKEVLSTLGIDDNTPPWLSPFIILGFPFLVAAHLVKKISMPKTWLIIANSCANGLAAFCASSNAFGASAAVALAPAAGFDSATTFLSGGDVKNNAQEAQEAQEAFVSRTGLSKKEDIVQQHTRVST